MIKIYDNPERAVWKELSERVTDSDARIEESVRRILDEVRNGGDDAIRDITERIDGFRPDGLAVTDAEFAEAEASVDDNLQIAIDIAIGNIRKFHESQRFDGIDVTTSQGVRCLQRAVAIERVGLYIPGGSAPLFSTVLMLAVPAKVAGCREVVLCTPAGRDGRVAPQVLYAARRCGVKNVFKIGGAQAVAAMAFGTDSIPRVDKIFGPGNRYVTTAKQIVSRWVAIDMPAGPSEVMVLADDDADVEFVAADMLSQAEHGRDSQAVLVCRSREFADRVSAELVRRIALLPREGIAAESIDKSRIVIFDNTDTVVDFANAYAAEHLIISMDAPWHVAERITAAGSVFVGKYSPESAGDYASGTNHTLPTSGWARSCSGVNLDSFVRKITYQELSTEGLEGLSDTIITMAQAEGLEAHAEAVRVRIDKFKREK